MSQSLFQQMVFCNNANILKKQKKCQSQSLFQQMVFCNLNCKLQLLKGSMCHNPYFSRWFSAIFLLTCCGLLHIVTILILVDGFLQFDYLYCRETPEEKVTILILVDGFLQQPRKFLKISLYYAKNLYLVTVSVNFTLPNLCI